MLCPNCGGRNTEVLSSYPSKKNTIVHLLNANYRRRKCKDCGYRWNSYEIPSDTLRTIIEHAQEHGEEEEIALDDKNFG